MISLGTWFWLMVAFFALMGMMRGWTREIIVTSALVLSLFFLNQFGAQIISLIGTVDDPAVLMADPMAAQRRKFYVLTIVHIFFTFWGYQGPTLAGSRLGERLRVRDSLQDKVLGAIVGAVNGYLIIGTIWAFLEYSPVAPGDWLPLNAAYPFKESVLVRPAEVLALVQRLPIPTLSPYLTFLVVIVFLFVIIVMI
ncbi:MAG: CvpA family protein [Ardenticatenaceae bacterium]|nr:CvpA family protein [Ardenticatenaceae bacterium]MCB9442828.1 CvpA family protein [Ardenticatenaceae bacterium]